MTLTQRQINEKKYYDQFVNMHPPDFEVDFEPVADDARRPWNSYWFLYQRARELKPSTGTPRLLDFGCGSGNNSIRLAHLGYEVSGFDISDENIRVAHDLAKKYNLEDTTLFTVQTAENLDYENDYFDTVVGIDILHHVNITNCLKEICRVLKPGGTAVFREPIESPIFDPIRNLSIVKRFVPNTCSFDRHITEDEKKLSQSEVRLIRSSTQNCQITYFDITARFSRFVHTRVFKLRPYVEKLDYYYLRKIGLLGSLLAGSGVIEFQKS
jgi:2-polyprenyl-3-methyl-5-hydroxy-6-metoxy-1,4-benzoquinol methylase